MSLSYPVAADADTALKAPLGHALTKASARRLADGDVVFETVFLRFSPKEAEALESEILTAVSTGAVQVYETDPGRSVISLKFWRPLAADEPETAPSAPRRPTSAHADADDSDDETPASGDAASGSEDAAASGEAATDHADDLYFRTGRTKRRGRKRDENPNQGDLFG